MQHLPSKHTILPRSRYNKGFRENILLEIFDDRNFHVRHLYCIISLRIEMDLRIFCQVFWIYIIFSVDKPNDYNVVINNISRIYCTKLKVRKYKHLIRFLIIAIHLFFTCSLICCLIKQANDVLPYETYIWKIFKENGSDRKWVNLMKRVGPCFKSTWSFVWCFDAISSSHNSNPHCSTSYIQLFFRPDDQLKYQIRL